MKTTSQEILERIWDISENWKNNILKINNVATPSKINTKKLHKDKVIYVISCANKFGLIYGDEPFIVSMSGSPFVGYLHVEDISHIYLVTRSNNT